MKENYILKKNDVKLACFDAGNLARDCVFILDADTVEVYGKEYTADEFCKIVDSVSPKSERLLTLAECEEKDKKAIREYIVKHEDEFKTNYPESVEIWDIETVDGFYIDTILFEYIGTILSHDEYYKYMARLICTIKGWRYNDD